MATISLKPNESFEHLHHEQSVTTLVAGKGRYESAELSFEMEIGIDINVPSQKVHNIINTGSDVCVFACRYGGENA